MSLWLLVLVGLVIIGAAVFAIFFFLLGRPKDE
jgi:hypothetical protein